MDVFSKYMKKYWKLFFAAISCLLIEVICDLMQPKMLSIIIDKGVAHKDAGFVLHMGLIMLLITLAGATGAVGRNIISSNVSQKFGSEMRSDLYKKIQTFSFNNIDKFNTASLITRVTNDVTQVQNFVNGLMRIFVRAPLLCLGSLIMAIRLNPGMVYILAVILPIIIILIIVNIKTGYPLFARIQKALDKVNGVMREYLSGVRVVKAFNRFNYEDERFQNANSELSSISVSAMRIMAIFNPGITLAVNLGIVAVLWIGGVKVNNGSMHVGQIMAFINYMTQILFSLTMISFIFTMFVRAKASLERIHEVFVEENDIKDCAESSKQSGGDRSVHFENVFFSYPGSSGLPALKEISFSCVRGETVGIIGATGSGKSTLVNLLPRFYDVSGGTIKINGTDVREIELKRLRKDIAVVPQKTMLFTGSILDNIKWGKEDATLEEVVEAAKAAQAHEFISSFPEGYNTILGQGGVNLSGGQKQRISIARALIKKPHILIFDDCTSAVDTATEAGIREGLKRYSRDTICFIIAQRITSVMEADKIIVLNNGEIAGIGTGEELMAGCSIFQDIFRSQIGKGDSYGVRE